eukprot:scaffold873_cov252-Pinguiococcus_pyrenoidosus.AAC.9
MRASAAAYFSLLQAKKHMHSRHIVAATIAATKAAPILGGLTLSRGSSVGEKDTSGASGAWARHRSKLSIAYRQDGRASGASCRFQRGRGGGRPDGCGWDRGWRRLRAGRGRGGRQHANAAAPRRAILLFDFLLVHHVSLSDWDPEDVRVVIQRDLEHRLVLA